MGGGWIGFSWVMGRRQGIGGEEGNARWWGGSRKLKGGGGRGAVALRRRRRRTGPGCVSGSGSGLHRRSLWLTGRGRGPRECKGPSSTLPLPSFWAWSMGGRDEAAGARAFLGNPCRRHHNSLQLHVLPCQLRGPVGIVCLLPFQNVCVPPTKPSRAARRVEKGHKPPVLSSVCVRKAH